MKVVVDKRFRAYDAGVERALKRALSRSAAVGVAAARSKSTPYRLQGILSKMKALPPERTAKGLGVFIVLPDFRAIWFELGTYRKRKRKLKQKTIARQQTAGGQARVAASAGRQGVKPGYFLSTAVRIAKQAMLTELKRAMPR